MLQFKRFNLLFAAATVLILALVLMGCATDPYANLAANAVVAQTQHSSRAVFCETWNLDRREYICGVAAPALRTASNP